MSVEYPLRRHPESVGLKTLQNLFHDNRAEKPTDLAEKKVLFPRTPRTRFFQLWAKGQSLPQEAKEGLHSVPPSYHDICWKMHP